MKVSSLFSARLLCSMAVLGGLGSLEAAPAISLLVPAAGSSTDAPNAGAVFPLVSSDERYITFGSSSTNLFAGQIDTNGGNDIFQRDTQTNTTTLISHTAGSVSTAGNAAFAGQPRASNDGRFVIYATSATDLVTGQGGGQRPYLWDRNTNTNIILADVQAQGVTISGDGNWLAIYALTSTSPLKPMPKNIYDVGQGSFTATAYTTGFIINRVTGVVTMISHQVGNTEAAAPVDLQSMWVSENGRYYVFETSIYPAWGGYTGTFVTNSEGLYMYDRLDDSLTLISKKNDGSAPSIMAINPTATYMSPDGRYVYFVQTDIDYGTASADTNGFGDVYRFDRDGGSTKLSRLFYDDYPLSPAPDNVTGNVSASPDGRFITFSSIATNLVAGDTNSRGDVFRYDTNTSVMERVNVNSDGSQWTDAANGVPSAFGVGNPRVLNTGTVYFNTTARALGFTDTNALNDIVKATFGPVTSVPALTTAAQASVTANSATLGGNVTGDGGSTVSERGIVWSTAAAPAIDDTNDTKVANGSGVGTFSATVGSLPGGTLIYVRAYAINTTGTGYGNEISFTTLAAPTVTTASATSVTHNSATLGGNVTADGGSAVTARGIVWSTVTAPAIDDSNDTTETNGSGNGSFSETVSGLPASTLIYVRAYATNGVGTSYGTETSFTTAAPPVPEVAVSGNAVNIVNGDSSPSETDHTDFGSVPQSGVSVSRTFTISNPGTAVLNLVSLPIVAVTGAHPGDFTVTQQPSATVASGGGTTTFVVSFDPSVIGLRTAQISFSSNDSDESPFTFDIQGTGRGPQTFDLAITPNALGNVPYDDGQTYILSATDSTAPSIDSRTLGVVGGTTATLGATVVNDGGSMITERGIVYSSSDPTPAVGSPGSLTAVAAGTTGVYTVDVIGLLPNTLYYFSGYATNAEGTAYTAAGSFTTGSASPEPVPTTLGDVVTAGGAPGADGTSDIGDFGVLRRGGFLAENGYLVFPGTLQIGTGVPPVTLATSSGLWKTAGGNLFLLARSGTTVPDVATAQFSTLPEVPGISAGGDVSFLGTLNIGVGGVTSDNDTGLWSELGGTGLSLLIREDDAVPGLSGVKVGKFATGIYATATTGASTGQAAFSVTYKGTSTKSALLRASVNGATTTVTVIATEGEDAPGTAVDFANLAGSYSDPGRMDSLGNFAFSALTTPGNKEGIWYQPVAGSTSKVVFSGETAPNTSGATFLKIYRPSIGSGGVIAFRASLNANGDNNLSTRNDGIWRGDASNPASFTCILRRGDDNTVVSNLPAGSRVGNPWGGWLTATNRGAWRAWLDTNGDFTSASPTDKHAIYTDLSGVMQLAVTVDNAAPGTAGATFSGFDLPVVGGNNQYAFIGNLAGGDTVPENNQGLWKSAPNGGALTLVLRKGDSVVTSEGSKIITKIDLPGSLQTDRRWEQPVIDNTGRMVVYITFGDGSTSQILAP